MNKDEIIAENRRLIDAATLAAVQNRVFSELETYLQHSEKQGWTQLVRAIRKLIEGESEEDVLSGLDDEDSTVVRAVLCNLADKDALVNNLLNSALQLIGTSTQEATRLANVALSIDVDNSNTHAVIGQILHQENQYAEALAAYERSIALGSDNVIVLLNAGVLQTETKKFEEAVETFRKVLALEAENVAAIFHLAYLYERSYRLEDAEVLIDKGLSIAPDNAELLLIRGKLLQRDSRINEAIDVYEHSLSSGLQPGMVCELTSRLGYLYDRSDNPDKALEYFQRSNAEYIKNCNVLRITREDFLSEVRYLDSLEMEGGVRPVWDDVAEYRSPVFLVGFPRSGTTLLNQVLDSHQDIVTIEEKPAATNMFSAFRSLVDSKKDGLQRLTKDDRASLRDVYFATVIENVEYDPKKILVDKFPLNIVYVRLLREIFPESKFILATRHPCDSILSCYMHSFGSNSAMLNFADIDTTIDLFSQVQNVWQRFTDEAEVSVLQVCYEDVVADFSAEARKIIEYLGLQWSDNLQDYYLNARKKGFIDTPSYDQVTEAVYKRAVNRWEKYSELFEPYRDKIGRIAKYYGYEYQA